MLPVRLSPKVAFYERCRMMSGWNGSGSFWTGVCQIRPVRIGHKSRGGPSINYVDLQESNIYPKKRRAFWARRARGYSVFS